MSEMCWEFPALIFFRSDFLGKSPRPPFAAYARVIGESCRGDKQQMGCRCKGNNWVTNRDVMMCGMFVR